MAINRAAVAVGFMVSGVLMVFFGTVLTFVRPIDHHRRPGGEGEPDPVGGPPQRGGRLRGSGRSRELHGDPYARACTDISVESGSACTSNMNTLLWTRGHVT